MLYSYNYKTMLHMLSVYLVLMPIFMGSARGTLSPMPVCPFPFELYQNGPSCYLLEAFVTGTKEQVEEFCGSWNAHLPIDPDMVSIVYLGAMLENSEAYMKSAWIGLTLVNGSYIWANGQPLSATWQPLMTMLHGQGDCTIVSGTTKLLHKDFCQSSRTAICQKDIEYLYHLTTDDTIPNVPFSCPIGWSLFRENQRCFQIVDDESVKRKKARGICTSQNSNLALIPDVATRQFINARLTKNHHYWLGHKWYEKYSVIKDYVSKEEFDFSGSWTIGEPDHSGTCIQWVAGTEMDGAADADCDLEGQYICEKGASLHIPKISKTCPSLWHLYAEGDTCFVEFGVTVGWTLAQDMCKRLDAELAKIHDDGTYTNVIEAAMEVRPWLKDCQADCQEWWIALTNDGGSREFYWMGEPKKIYDEWFPLTSSGSITDGDQCVSVSATERMWTVRDCFAEDILPLCQKPSENAIDYGVPRANIMTSSLKVVSLLNLTCPRNSTFDQKLKSCFRFFDERVNWTTASETCAKEKGHLLKIEFEDTANIAWDVFPDIDMIWIGLKFQAQEDKLVWEDGSSYESDFRPPRTSDLCLAIDSELMWVYRSCDDLYNFVCHYDKVMEEEKLSCIIVDGKEYHLSTRGIAYSEVPNACDEFEMDELFVESDEEFLALKGWFDWHRHVFSNNTWLRTRKNDSTTYYWADDNLVGETGIWADNSTGYSCYNSSKTLQDCCTMMYFQDDSTGYRLQEEYCIDQKLKAPFICVPRDETPSSSNASLPSTPSTGTNVINVPRIPGTQPPPHVSSNTFSNLSPATSSILSSSSPRPLMAITTPLPLSSLTSPPPPTTTPTTATSAITATTTSPAPFPKSVLGTSSPPPTKTTPTTATSAITATTTSPAPFPKSVLGTSSPPPTKTTPTTATSAITATTTSPAPFPKSVLGTSSPLPPPKPEISLPEEIPPLPPSAPLSHAEKEEFIKSLQDLKALLSTLQSPPLSHSNSTANQTTIQIQNKLCPCACAAFKFKGMPTPSAIANIVSKIQKALYVETSTLSSKRNKKISAKDDRTSSQKIAYVAIALAAVPLGLIVLIDLSRFYRFLKGKISRTKR